jgi:hypothetical protein
VIGIIDKSALKGLGKILKQGKYSFSEDTLVTMSKFCFDTEGFERLEYKVFTDNTLSLKLAKKAGFVKEGVLRHAFMIDDKYKNIAIFSKVKSLDMAESITKEGKDG